MFFAGAWRKKERQGKLDFHRSELAYHNHYNTKGGKLWDKYTRDHYEVLPLYPGDNSFQCSKEVGRNLHSRRLVRTVFKSDVTPTYFFDRLEILKDLDHPNLPPFYESFEEKNLYRLVMGHPGETNLIEAFEKIGWSEAGVAAIIRVLGSLLAYCHGHGIFFGRLDPEHIFVERVEKDSGQTMEDLARKLRVADFGTTRFFKKTYLQDDPEDEVGSVGTADTAALTIEEALIDLEPPIDPADEDPWEPPEGDRGEYGPKTDSWYLGILAYQLLTGRLPFGEEGTPETQEELEQVELFDGPEAQRLTDRAKQYIRSMLSFRPEDRPKVNDRPTGWLPEDLAGPIDRSQAHDTMTALLHFNAMTRLQKAVFAFSSAYVVSDTDKDRLVKIFQKADADSNGYLDPDELMAAVVELTGDELTKMSIEHFELGDSPNLRRRVEKAKLDADRHEAQLKMDLRKLERKGMPAKEAQRLWDQETKGGREAILRAGKPTRGDIEKYAQGVLDRIFARVDLNGDGKVEWSEFVAAATHRDFIQDRKDSTKHRSDMTQAFELFAKACPDSDPKYITQADLKALFNNTKADKVLHARLAQEMINKHDGDNDAMIDAEDFFQMMTGASRYCRVDKLPKKHAGAYTVVG